MTDTALCFKCYTEDGSHTDHQYVSRDYFNGYLDATVDNLA